MTFEPVDFQVRDLLRDLPDRLAGPKVARQGVLAPGGPLGAAAGRADRRPRRRRACRSATVLAGSPAAAAGLKPGDVLTTLDGRWTTSIADAYAAAADVAPGRDVRVVILRDGKEQTLTVRPGGRDLTRGARPRWPTRTSRSAEPIAARRLDPRRPRPRPRRIPGTAS